MAGKHPDRLENDYRLDNRLLDLGESLIERVHGLLMASSTAAMRFAMSFC